MLKLKSDLVTASDKAAQVLKAVVEGIVDAGGMPEDVENILSDPALKERVGEQFIVSTFRWIRGLRCRPRTVKTDKLLAETSKLVNEVNNVSLMSHLPDEVSLNYTARFDFCFTAAGLRPGQLIRLLRQMGEKVASPQLLLMCLPDILEFLEARSSREEIFRVDRQIDLFTERDGHSKTLPSLVLAFPDQQARAKHGWNKKPFMQPWDLAKTDLVPGRVLCGFLIEKDEGL